jgi:hypothetical protein
MDTNSLIPVLTRVPPGDRWELDGSMDGTIYTSLTEALNAVFIMKSTTVFVINAKVGKVYITPDDQISAPIKKYSLYDEQ